MRINNEELRDLPKCQLTEMCAGLGGRGQLHVPVNLPPITLMENMLGKPVNCLVSFCMLDGSIIRTGGL
jgi:hypothetical protein